MRLWHYELLPYLPDYQLKGQYRELVAIMRNWRDKGSPKSVIIDIIKEYPKNEFYEYFYGYSCYYHDRFKKNVLDKYKKEFMEFCNITEEIKVEPFYLMPFKSYHDKEYLRVCMANLYEKYKFGRGKSRISEMDWYRLLDRYRKITGEDYLL